MAMEEKDETGGEKQVVFRSHPAHPPLFNRPHPYLAITHGNRKQRQTFYNVSRGCYYTKIIPELRNKWICNGGRSGWLYVEDNNSNDCCFLNIVTMQEVKLPPLVEVASMVDGCIITSPPTDPDCRVLLYGDNHVVTCKPGDESFVKLDLIGFNGILVPNIMCQGKIYGLLLTELELVVADPVEPHRFEEVQLDQDSQLNFGSSGTSYLIESSGDLLLVHAYSINFIADILRFKTFRADFTKMKWVRLTSIENRAIFLDKYQGWSCSTTGLEGVLGNSIYFTYPNDRNMYVFNLDDESISIYLPCPIVNSSQSFLNWIMMPSINKP